MEINKGGINNFFDKPFMNSSSKASADVCAEACASGCKIDSNCCEVLDSYGRASINIRGICHFPSKGASQKSELEKLKKTNKKLYKLTKNLPEDIRQKAILYHFDMIDKKLAGKILSNQELSKDDNFMKSVGDIIANSIDENQANMRVAIFENLKNGGMLNDECIDENRAIQIIDGIKTQEQFDAKTDIINFLKDSKLLENENIKKITGDVIAITQTKKHAEAKICVMSWLEIGNFVDNESVVKNLDDIILNTKNIRRADVKGSLMEKIAHDEKLCKSELVEKYLGDMLSSTNTLKGLSVANKILSNEELYNSEIVMKKASQIIASVKTQKQAEVALDILSDKKFYTNEDAMKNIDRLIRSIY